MKKPLILLFLLLLPVLSGCGLFAAEVETSSSAPGEYSYVYTPESTTLPAPGTEESATVPSETETTAPAAEPSAIVTVPGIPLPSDTAPSSVAPASSEAPTPETSSAAPSSEAPSSSQGEIDLSIQMPEANGTMEVSLAPDNLFINAVHVSRGVDPSLLAAVYAVPESGQNYVFEFKTAAGRTADNLRRVYLLQGDGTIVSVAASNSAERENLSVTENWFCMNVLIKNMVFPAVKDQM